MHKRAREEMEGWKLNSQSSPAVPPRLPKSTRSIFAYNSRDSTPAAANEEEEEEDGGGTGGGERSLVAVRESIRCGGQPRFVPPIGYLEEFDTSSGHICYREAFSDDVIWFTSLDADGRLYFYTKDGRSEWALPKVKSTAAVDEADKAPTTTQKRAPTKADPKQQLSVLVCGILSRKLISGQVPGGAGPSLAGKKWAVRYGAVIENTLLFFPDVLR